MSDRPGPEPLELVRVVALVARHDDQRYPIALLGERAPGSDDPGADQTGAAFRLLGTQVRAALHDTGIAALQPYQDLELHGGTKEQYGFGISGGDEPLLTRTIFRGIRRAYPTWIVVRVYRSSIEPEPARVARMRRETDRIFAMLEALRDGGDLTIGRSGRLVHHENGALSDWAEAELDQLRKRVPHVVMPFPAGRHDTPRPTRAVHTVASAGRDDHGQEVIEALVERVDQVSDPLGRLVLMDELSRTVVPALHERMMGTAAEHRATVQPGTGEPGTWRQIGEALGVTPQAAQDRLDPAALPPEATKP